MLMHKRFAKALEQFMQEEDISPAALAWLIDAHVTTVTGWLRGNWFPSRQHAMKLIHFSDNLALFFEREGGVVFLRADAGSR